MIKRSIAIISITAISCCFLIKADERSGKPSYLYRIKRSRPIKACNEQIPDEKELFRNRTPEERVRTTVAYIISGIIDMPIEGQLHAKVEGYSYVADAESRTITITFENLESPIVVATALAEDALIEVRIIDRTPESVTLLLEDFDPNQPTIVEFRAVELEDK